EEEPDCARATPASNKLIITARALKNDSLLIGSSTQPNRAGIRSHSLDSDAASGNHQKCNAGTGGTQRAFGPRHRLRPCEASSSGSTQFCFCPESSASAIVLRNPRATVADDAAHSTYTSQCQ